MPNSCASVTRGSICARNVRLTAQRLQTLRFLSSRGKDIDICLFDTQPELLLQQPRSLLAAYSPTPSPPTHKYRRMALATEQRR